MDIRQLRYFVVIAEERQLTRAAHRLHMAQPPLSRQLTLLEQELGVPLFERNGRNMDLTEAGKLLFKRAECILNQLHETVAEVKETGEGLRGVLTIGTIHSCIPYLSGVIRSFRETYPLVTFKLWEESPSRLSEHLEKRDVELAILRSPIKMDHFSMLRLPEEPFVLVTPPTWTRFDSQAAIALDELHGVPLLLLHKGKEMSYHEWVVNECRRLGLELDIICECPDAAMLLMLVAGGIGAAILPKSFAMYIPREFVKIKDIADFPFQSESYLIWMKNRHLSKVASRFIQTCRHTQAVASFETRL